MKHITMALIAVILNCLSFLSVPVSAESGISVGDLERKVVDSVAVLGDFFGRPSLDVYLFSKKLSKTQKMEVAFNEDRIEEQIGVEPVAQLMLFFDQNSRDCTSIISYTMVFQKSNSLPIPVQTDSPINWAFSSSTLSNYGVSLTDCSLKDDGYLTLKVKYFHNLDKEYEKTFFNTPVLNPEIDSLVFFWDLSIDTIIIDKQKKFLTTQSKKPGLTLSSSQIADSDSIYIEKYKLLVVRFYNQKVVQYMKGDRASANSTAQIGSASLTLDSLSGENKISRCLLGVWEDISNNERLVHSIPCNGIGKVLKVSTGRKKGQKIAIDLKGEGEPDVRTRRPRVNWDISLESVVEGVFDQ